MDYLAEVLKEMRKEDHMHDYKSLFVLSKTITTRDKDSIAKSFSGLIKVIYPHGKYTEEEAQELLDFAIEGRKRVKQQLTKMDETFEEVDFSYQVISSGKKNTVETLEIMEYTKPLFEEMKQDKAEIEPVKEPKKIRKEGQKIILDNQTGISYEMLFGDYLEGSEQITVIDPYVRLPYQLRNFMELTQLISKHKRLEDEVKLHLVTNNNEDYMENAQESFNQMSDSLEPIGIYFTYDFLR